MNMRNKSLLTIVLVCMVLSCYANKNCLNRAKLLCDVSYTIARDLPVQGKIDHYEKGAKIEGVPYSSVRSTDKFIGQNISLYSFLTALKNPESDIYTKISTTSNSRCWYGVVCSSFLGFVYDLPYRPTTKEFQYVEGVKEKKLEDIEICDFCLCRSDWNKITSSGHVLLITDVERDSAGSIAEIEVTEAKVPKVTRTRYSYKLFKKIFRDKNYKAFAHPDLTHVSFDSSLREMLENKNYFDSLKVNICTNLGDRVNIWKEDTILINPVNPDVAKQISVFRNDTLLFSTGVKTLTLYDLQPGRYKAEMDDSDHSSTSWIVCDAYVEKIYDNYYFSGDFCVPSHLSFNDKSGCSYKSYPFSKENIDNGCFATDFYAKYAKYPKIYFKNEYGSLAKPILFNDILNEKK